MTHRLGDDPRPRNTPPGIQSENDIGRSPGSQVLIAGPAFPAGLASGVRGARLAVHSCGGSPGIGDRKAAAPDSLFIPTDECRRETLIVYRFILALNRQERQPGLLRASYITMQSRPSVQLNSLIVQCTMIISHRVLNPFAHGQPFLAKPSWIVTLMNRKHLLIVDDDPGFGQFVRQVALTLDYEVTVTTSGREFQKRYPEIQPTLIVLDMVIPDIDGNELLLWLLQQGYAAGLIVTTGFSPDYAQDAKTLAEFKGLRGVTTLVKPFTPAELRAALDRQV